MSANKRCSLIQVFDSVEDCLRWGHFEAAVVMVPHHLHESHASSLLAAGKHVLLEKPLAHNLDSCTRLLETAKQSKSLLMVGENSAHWPEVSIYKHIIIIIVIIT